MLALNFFKSAFFEVVKLPHYFFSWILISLIFFFIYLYIPVISVPGNDLFFQIAITPSYLLALMFFLSVLSGLLLVMQGFIFFRLKNPGINSTVSGVPGIISGVIGGVFASASCAACINVFLSFLGATTIGLLLEKRFELIALSIAIILIGLYFASKRISVSCNSCKID